MKNDNGFDILVEDVFSTRPQLGGIGTNAKELVTPFKFIEGESLPDFHLIYLQAISEIYLSNDKTGH